MKKINKSIMYFGFLFVLLVSIFIGSFFFYSSEEGLKSVYDASFDWKIDFLATLSGLYVLSIATYLVINKKIGIFSFLILAIIGATQSMMHIAKWIVRVNIA